MKHYRFTFLATLILLFVGCNEDEQVAYNVATDAFVRGMNIEGKASYAPVLIAQTSAKTASLTALDANAKKYTLESYWNNSLFYRWLPDSADYKSSLAESMTFHFTATAEDSDKTVTETETVSFSHVPKSFEIIQVAFDTKTSQLKIAWQNEGADSYFIQISESLDATPIFQSRRLQTRESSKKEVSIILDESSFNWFKSPETNKRYLLSVHAYNFVNNNTGNIGGEFVATKYFTWGK